MAAIPTEPDLYAERGVLDEDRQDWESYRVALRDIGYVAPPPLWALKTEGFPAFGRLKTTPLLPWQSSYATPTFSLDDIDEAKLILSLI